MKLKKMVLEMVKYVRVKLEQLLGHVVHGDLAYLAHQLHLKKAKDSRSTKNSERSFPVKSKSTKTRAKCPKDLLFVASSSTIGESIPLMISNKSLGLQCSCRRSRILTNIGYGPIEYYLE